MTKDEKTMLESFRLLDPSDQQRVLTEIKELSRKRVDTLIPREFD